MTNPTLPHVLIVSPQYPGADGPCSGGLYTHARELHLGLAELGCPVTVLAPRLDGPSRVEGNVHWLSPGEAVRRLPAGPDGEPTLEQLRLYSQELVAHACAITAGAGRRPDIIHVHDHWLAPAAIELRRQLEVPLALTIHLLHAPLREWWGTPVDPMIAALERHALHSADAVIAVSAAIGEVLRSAHGVEERRIAMVHNGFNAALFTQALEPSARQAVREHLGLPAGPVVVYAGRMTRQKGIAPFVRSAASVIAERPDVVHVLAGACLDMPDPTPEQREIICEVDHVLERVPALRPRVRFLGDLPRDELAQLYQIAALAVVPSLYEPFGYAVVEPMAAGVPVVASSVGGIPEIIEHERSGMLVPMLPPRDGVAAPDEAAMAEAQLRLLGDGALAAALGHHGRERVLASFTRERMARETLRVYQDTIVRT